jgi:hypothetical protein
VPTEWPDVGALVTERALRNSTLKFALNALSTMPATSTELDEVRKLVDQLRRLVDEKRGTADVGAV